MAIFKKQEPQKSRERSAPPPRSSQSDAAISIIGSGMTIVGDITTEGTVRIEGVVEGTIRAGTAVVLGQAGTVEGDILTQDAVIGGTVRGSIVATNRLELQSTSTVSGMIRARTEHLKLEEGARFAGQVQMMDEGALESASPTSEVDAAVATEEPAPGPSEATFDEAAGALELDSEQHSDVVESVLEGDDEEASRQRRKGSHARA